MSVVSNLTNSMLIIKSQPHSLLPVENFLKNRGWTLYSTYNLKDAISVMLRERPFFVLVSVDHSSNKLTAFCKVIAQSFPCCLILFAEKVHDRSYQLLANSGCEYIIYPPMTGPAVERTILKYHRHQSAVQPTNSEAEMLLNSMVVVRDDKITIANSQKQIENFLVEFSKEASDKENLTSTTASHNAESSFEADETLIPTRLHSDTKLLRGSKVALEESVRLSINSTHPLQTLSDCSQISCVKIETSTTSGYLLIAVGKNKKPDEALVNAIHEKVFNFLAETDECVTSAQNMMLTLNLVSFEDWAIEHAEFLRKAVHLDDEIALAFFSHKKVAPHCEKSGSDQMFSIALEDLKVDIPVEFNLYLYLPANHKYILYTPRGAVLYTKQMNKLTRQGVTQMHFHSNETQDFEVYRAQNFLNDKIDNFKQEMRIKAANMLSSQ